MVRQCANEVLLLEVAMPEMYVGIDFSGSQPQWNPNVQASNVWLATLEANGEAVTLVNLQRVQQLPGPGRPFARLAAWLADMKHTAAAIDAPFSIPWWFFGHGFVDHPALLAMVDGLRLHPAQDFPNGHEFVANAAADIPFEYTKPLRVTESYWRGRGVNIRSTVWNGPRPGAPFTSACIKLLAQASCPVWPWAGHQTGVLVEAFPAAQLKHWGLPLSQYSGPGGQANRNVIVAELMATRGLQVDEADLEIMRKNADALDAVLCSYAARAVIKDLLEAEIPPFNAWHTEGWIAVHD